MRFLNFRKPAIEAEEAALLANRESKAELRRILAEAVRNTVQPNKIKNDDRTAH